MKFAVISFCRYFIYNCNRLKIQCFKLKVIIWSETEFVCIQITYCLEGCNIWIWKLIILKRRLTKLSKCNDENSLELLSGKKEKRSFCSEKLCILVMWSLMYWSGTQQIITKLLRAHVLVVHYYLNEKSIDSCREEIRHILITT